MEVTHTHMHMHGMGMFAVHECGFHLLIILQMYVYVHAGYGVYSSRAM